MVFITMRNNHTSKYSHSNLNINRRTPNAAILRLEPLESRELLDASSILAPTLFNDANFACVDFIDAKIIEPIDLSNAVAGTTWRVTSTADDGSTGTLRYAIANAADQDTITFAPNLKGATITLNGNQLEITKSITIDASNLYDESTQTPGITIDADAKSRVFYINQAGNVALNGLTITNGKVNGNGGGIYSASTVSYINCTIANNTASSSSSISGGGIYQSGAATYANCTITNNTASSNGNYAYGGGIYQGGGRATYTNCLVKGNVASAVNGYDAYGGGIYQNETASYVNCAIAENTASTGVNSNASEAYGGGIYARNNATYTNCTVVGNKVAGYSVYCGGIYNHVATATFYNSILALNGNDDLYNHAGTLKAYNSLSTYSDWANKSDFDVVNYLYDSQKPLFNSSFTALATNSQARNRGNNAYVADYDVDLAGNPRVADEIVDLGAYEGQTVNRKTLVVTSIADDGSEGTLRYALANADDEDTITFASSLKDKTITLNGTQLNIAKSITIDASNLYDATTQTPGVTINADERSRVFSVNHAGNVNLIGLAIANGKYSGNGGGVYVYDFAKVAFTDCTITNNTASSRGGGVYAYDFASVAFTNCSIANNTSSSGGGGVWLGGVYNGRKATYDNCSIINNTSTNSYGGGIYQSATTTCVNCTIMGNASGSEGGGIYQSGTATYADCVITNNASGSSGGGIYQSGAVDYTGCTFISNTSGSSGGAIYQSGTANYTNCTIANNTASSSSSISGGGICQSGAATYANCTITNNTASSNGNYAYGGGIYQGGGRATYTNCLVKGNVASAVNGYDAYGGGIYQNETASYVNCAIAENTASTGVNSNASEAYGGGIYARNNATYTNCTVVGNKVAGYSVYCGGIYNHVATATFYNSILALNGNDDLYNHAGTLKAYNSLSTYSDWANKSDFDVVNYLYDSEKPLFNNAQQGDYLLASDSQAINKGNNNYVTTTTDLAGNARISDEIVDLGAYERQVQTKLETPTPRVTDSAPTSIAINWEAIANASGYTLQYKESDVSSWSTAPTIGASTTSYTLSELSVGTSYDLRLLANGSGVYTDSNFSPVVSYSTKAQQLDPLTFVATDSTPTSISVAWSEVVNASGYELTLGAGTPILLDKDATSYVFENLKDSTSYTIQARARGDGAHYLDSEYLTATVKTKELRTLAKPTISSFAASSSSIAVAWTSSDGAVSYTVKYAPSDGSAGAKTVVVKTRTSKTISGLKSNTRYDFSICANGDGKETRRSGYGAVTTIATSVEQSTLLAPTLAATKTASTITVEWEAVANASGYELTLGTGTSILLDGNTTSYVFENLKYSTSYAIKARALGDNVQYLDSEYSTTTVKTNALRVLSKPVVTEETPSGTAITVAWTSSDGAASYTVKYAPSDGSADAKTVVVKTGTSKTISGLKSNTRYDFSICANGDGKETRMSGYGAVTTIATSVEQSTLLAPTLAATKTASTITVEWEAVANASGYELTLGTGTSILLDGNTTSYVFENLKYSTSYAIKARALGDNVQYLDSEYSTTTVKTNALRVLSKPVVTEGTPSGTAITVAWTSSDGAASYTVKYAPSDGSAAVKTVVVKTGTNKTISGLKGNTRYDFSVCANGDGKETRKSGYGVVTTIATSADEAEPQTMTLSTTKTASTITVKWDAIVNASYYELSLGAETPIVVDGNTTSYVFTNLKYSTSYTIKARALGDSSQSLDAEYATATVKTNALQTLAKPIITSAASSSNSITVGWNAQAGAASYTVKYAPSDGSAAAKTVVVKSGTSKTISGLKSNTRYDFSICANGDGKETRMSGYNAVTTLQTFGSANALLDQAFAELFENELDFEF